MVAEFPLSLFASRVVVTTSSRTEFPTVLYSRTIASSRFASALLVDSYYSPSGSLDPWAVTAKIGSSARVGFLGSLQLGSSGGSFRLPQQSSGVSKGKAPLGGASTSGFGKWGNKINKIFRGRGGGKQQGFQQGRGYKPEVEESQQSTARQPVEFRCYNYDQLGHLARNCPYPRREEHHSSSSSSLQLSEVEVRLTREEEDENE
ncbi:hypothetical protein Taro_037950 [Colocasia esculenta]|uniref:CCHC-type domain-containing protein n=1 Tax=Colocasia esculenta TaxID=4460 RepID=A0A843WM72_COLES|nr:hypothetical protein [Colocasia esculenta]